MYTKFWNLKEEPFSTSPDPRFLYRGEMHQEALDRLMASVTLKRGISAIIGEPGLGKSTLIRTMLYSMQDSVNIAWVFNTTMDAAELLKYIARDFGMKPKSEDKSGLLMEVYTFLIKEYQAGRTPVLIVDEAQNLSKEALEEIRQLSNLETVNKKLIQVILAGQPQLDEKLMEPDLTQLVQRIALKARLNRLDETDTLNYIKHRLAVAGAQQEIFSPAACKAVYKISDGVPRVINQICENALLTAARRQEHTVDAVMIHELVEKGIVVQVQPHIEEKPKAVLIEETKYPKPPVKAVRRPEPQKRQQIIQEETSDFGFIDISELISVM